ncbi:hypothetical protein BC826DRAFT_975994 [Russula brevipes]|nr:hypothetical protein BC826DRAFT_975994 [Russula brevipes]
MIHTVQPSSAGPIHMTHVQISAIGAGTIGRWQDEWGAAPTNAVPAPISLFPAPTNLMPAPTSLVPAPIKVVLAWTNGAGMDQQCQHGPMVPAPTQHAVGAGILLVPVSNWCGSSLGGTGTLLAGASTLLVPGTPLVGAAPYRCRHPIGGCGLPIGAGILLSWGWWFQNFRANRSLKTSVSLISFRHKPNFPNTSWHPIGRRQHPIGAGILLVLILADFGPDGWTKFDPNQVSDGWTWYLTSQKVV